MSHIVQDLKFAFRGFARTPGVTLLAVLALAIGVGANAAIFSVVHNVMIDPLPYPAADRVVIPWRTSAAMGGLSVSASPTDLDNWAKTGVGSADTGVGCGGAVRMRIAGRVDAGAARHACGSDGRVARRMIRTCEAGGIAWTPAA